MFHHTTEMHRENGLKKIKKFKTYLRQHDSFLPEGWETWWETPRWI